MILIITREPYPNGNARTKRLHYYAKAIVNAGGNALLLLPNPSKRFYKNFDAKGQFEGINFRYTCKTAVRPTNIFPRNLARMRGHFNIIAYLIWNRETIDGVIMGGLSYFFWDILYSQLLHLLRIPSIYEANEYPFFKNVPKYVHEKLYQRFHKYLNPRLYDGFFIISNTLLNYYKSRTRKEVPLLNIPVLIDLDEYKDEITEGKRLTIVCNGTLSELKDGTLSLIRAFSLLLKKFPKYRLILTGGDPDYPHCQIAKTLVRELHIENSVDFTGFISRDELIHQQQMASLLVLAKPTSIHADYCFPSKLAEYLATGNPIVVTNTGEISKVLKDKENAFFTEADSVEKLAEKMENVLLNYNEAINVGMNGKKIAETIFDYKKYGIIIIDFIESLKAK